LTLIRIFEALCGLGYEGGYDAVRRYARVWQRDQAASAVGAFIPLSFAPGEAYQFDWSHEVVLINGTTVTVKMAHIRLCHSRMLFVRAYPRETQEMVFDAHDRAFGFFKGACTRGIYDFVPGNKIVLMCPPPLCGGARGPGRFRGGPRTLGHITGYSAFSQSSRILSLFQAARVRDAAEIPEPTSQTRRASALARKVNSA